MSLTKVSGCLSRSYRPRSYGQDRLCVAGLRRPPGRAGELGARLSQQAHSPRQTGGRFSAKATAPSLASAEVNTALVTSRCRANAVSAGQSADSTITRLV